MSRSIPTAKQVTSHEDRERALQVLTKVYEKEKGWVGEGESLFPVQDLDDESVAWFLAEQDGRPLGTTRVLYDLPKELYAAYGFDLVDADLDVEAFLEHNRVAEIGRFAVVAESRASFLISAALMKATTEETVRREYSHYVTDVFEDEENSPYGFHRRVLGFRTVATHRTGELNCTSRRITMLLDLNEAFKRLQAKNSWIFRFVIDGWDEPLVRRLCA